MKNFRQMSNEEIKGLTVDEIEDVLDQMFEENEKILKAWDITENLQKRIEEFLKSKKYEKDEKDSILISLFSVGATVVERNTTLLALKVGQNSKLERNELDLIPGCNYILTHEDGKKYLIEEGEVLGLTVGWGVFEVN